MNAEPNFPLPPIYRLDRDLPTGGAIGSLMQLRCWVTWNYDWSGTRWTKPPRSAHTGNKAGATDPAAWGTYAEARATQKRRGLAGLGISLDALPDVFGFDLDHCLDAEGKPEPWAMDLLDLAETYAEVSPSGGGLRFLARGSIPAAVKCDAAGIEIYATGRFLTITGDHVTRTPDDIRPAPKTLELLKARVEATKKREEAKAGAAGEKKAFKIDTGDDFFGNVKTAALANLAAWVPALFPQAVFQPRTGAWRVSSRSLGRDLEEDLSLAPGGIQDFGAERGLTAIDVVIDHGGAATPLEAALWLCEKMGTDPGSLGYAARTNEGWGQTKQGSTEGSTSGASDEFDKTKWTEPDARFLRTVLPEPPALPLNDVFSSGWTRWIRTAAEAKGAPADYVVAALLSTAGALIGNTRWVTPWEGWSEVPIIWAMAIGNPSAGKSPGLDAVLTPLKRIEREARQAAEAEHLEWMKKAEVARLVESTWKEAVKAALKSGDVVPEKPGEARPGPEPVKPRYALADATVEKLAVIVAAQPRGALMARDELSAWLGNMSRYSGGSDRPFWLEAYGGRGYNVERMGRESIWIDHLSVGVLGGIQPDKLKSLLIKTDDDGLLARFLPVFPNPAPIRQPETGIDDAFIEAAFKRLLTLTLAQTETGEMRPWYVRFSDGARGLLNAFRKEAREWEAGQEGLILSFIGKLPGMAVRLSLILALLDWAEGGPDPHEISEEHFERAAAFIDAYVLPMARRAYADGSTPKELSAGAKLAAIIRERRWQRFTTSDVLRLNRAGLNTKAALDPALDALETGDLIRAVDPKSEHRGRGRPSRTFVVNPAIGGGG